MTTTTPTRVRVAALAALVPTAGIAVAVAAPAAATGDPCPTGWTLVPDTDDVCSMTVTASGPVTVPANLTSLQALLVGGGAGASGIPLPSDNLASYAGGGGEVELVDPLALPQDRTVTIAVGGGGLGEWLPMSPPPLSFSADVYGGDTTLTSGATTHTATGGVPREDVADAIVAQLPSAWVAGILSAPGPLWPAFTGESPLSGDGAEGELLEGTDGDNTCPAHLEDVSGSGAAGTGQGADGPSQFEHLTSNTLICREDPGNGGSGVVVLRAYLATLTASSPSVGGAVGTAIAPVTFTGTRLTGPVTYSASPTLPAGLALTNGVLSGTPTGGVASTSFTITATDANGTVVTKTITIAVDGDPGSEPTPTPTPTSGPTSTPTPGATAGTGSGSAGGGTSSGSGGLASTGSSPAAPLAAATVLLGAGLAVLGLSRRARRQP